jgi:hypothetical protein
MNAASTDFPRTRAGHRGAGIRWLARRLRRIPATSPLLALVSQSGAEQSVQERF